MSIYYTKPIFVVLQVGSLTSKKTSAHYELTLQTEKYRENDTEGIYRLDVHFKVYEMFNYSEENPKGIVGEECADVICHNYSILMTMRMVINRAIIQFQNEYNRLDEYFRFSSHRIVSTEKICSLIRPYEIKNGGYIYDGNREEISKR